MKRSFIAVSLLSIILLAYGSARAQIGRGINLPNIFGDWHVSVGNGASYLIERGGKDKPMSYDIAVVGEEKVDGQSGYWLEMTMADRRDGSPMIMKSLFVKSPNEISVKRMVMKTGNQPAMEFPLALLSSMGSSPLPKEAFNLKDKAKLVGKETISTPAGSFACDHYQMTDKDGTSDVWISSKVSPYGLVKSMGPHGSMVLQKVLTGQKTKITETPQKMDIPFGNRQ